MVSFCMVGQMPRLGNVGSEGVLLRIAGSTRGKVPR